MSFAFKCGTNVTAQAAPSRSHLPAMGAGRPHRANVGRDEISLVFTKSKMHFQGARKSLLNILVHLVSTPLQTYKMLCIFILACTRLMQK